MRLLLLLAVVTGITWAVMVYWERLAAFDSKWTEKQLASWFVRGVVAPVMVWMVYCTGLGGVISYIDWVAKSRGVSLVWAFIWVFCYALTLIASFWAAVTLAWIFATVWRRMPPENRAEFYALSVIGAVCSMPVWLAILFLFGWPSAGLAAAAGLVPMVHITVGLVPVKRLGPMYSRAIASMKMGKFGTAEWEVIKQLEECEDDFEGWMLLAQLYGEHYGDLKLVEETICQLCEQPNLTSAQIAAALLRLANWQLKLGQDPVAARLTLEEISRRLPGTNLDRMARQQAEQLPTTSAEWVEQQKGRKISMPVEVDPYEELQEWREAAKSRVDRLVEQLRKNPDDVAARENLARGLAEGLGRIDLAIEQLELLREIPDQPDSKLAHWLVLQATWELRYRQDSAACQTLLHRVLSEYPQTHQAFFAQRRLSLLEREQRFGHRGDRSSGCD